MIDKRMERIPDVEQNDDVRGETTAFAAINYKLKIKDVFLHKYTELHSSEYHVQSNYIVRLLRGRYKV